MKPAKEKTNKSNLSSQSKNAHQQTFFAFFWAVAMFFNNLGQGFHLNLGLVGLISTANCLAAAYLLIKPSSVSRLMIVAILGVTDFYIRLPNMPNHFYIMGTVNVTILLTWFTLKYKKKLTVDWFDSLAKFLRLTFVIIYGAAAISKINSTFLSSRNSCAYFLPDREASYFNLSIDFQNYTFLPYFIAGIEIAIFFGLIVKRLRPFVIILACFFHLSLSLTPVSQGLRFTFVLIGLICLFIPLETISEKINWLNRGSKELDKKIPLEFFKFIFGALVIILIAANLFAERTARTSLTIKWIFSLTILTLIAVMISWISFSSRNSKSGQSAFHVKGLLQFLVFISVVLTAISPYIGLKTRPTFTMYSNLQVEGNSTNHLIIPRLFYNNFADDLVEIKTSTDPTLEADARRGVKWVYLELQRRMIQYPETSITYVRNGQTFDLKRASENKDLMNPNPLLLKFLSFRKVYPDNFCSW